MNLRCQVAVILRHAKKNFGQCLLWGFTAVWFVLFPRDVAPEGETLDETNNNLDIIIDLTKELMKETGIKCLWVTCNLFSHPR